MAGHAARTPPPTRRVDVKETLFGVEVHDPYRWLEDLKDPAVQAWMAEQDRAARTALGASPGRDRLLRRFRELYYVDAASAPLHRGGRYFYTRRHADREKAVVYWREGAQGEERVLLDPNTMSADGSTSLGVWVPAWDGGKVAYALRPNNADEATLYVMEVATGEVSEVDVIEGGKYAEPSWTPEGDGFYYTWLPTDPRVPVADRPGRAEIRFHRLGTPPAADRQVHAATGDPRTFLSVDLSRDGRWLFVYVSHGWNSADVYLRDLASADSGWRPLVVGRDALYLVHAWQGRFYVLTNEGAPRFRVMRTEAARPERAAWVEVVPERKDAVIEEFRVLGGHLVLGYLENAASRLEVLTLEGRSVREVPLPALGSTFGLVGNPDEDEAFFGYQSFTTAPEIHRTSVRTGATSLWSAVKVPVDPSAFAVEQVWYPSRDGTRVSMFVVRGKDMRRDGSTPFVLYGYGGFSVSERPTFTTGIFPWLEAGGGFAVANLRGGGEYGEEWHRAGMRHRKQNVFDDFIGAAEYLQANGYTRPDRLAIMGGSNGGLLVGAAMVQRPELFRVVSCGVPLLDMVRYHLFGSGKTWIAEYGSADDEADFRTLLAYSPYHHVRKSPYPAVLMTSADTDDRVDPMHARKMTAALQAATTSGRPVLLRIERNAGHGGADMVKQAVELSADRYAFLMSEVGLTPRPDAAPPGETRESPR
ncbi:MAG TPA: prolyl oligopeptidase family serine peptidase [Vicinamibacteria bacterium]|nr:prolyl oligopeptidase family serine peptidase [Vicinamibacteria bacterium]